MDHAGHTPGKAPTGSATAGVKDVTPEAAAAADANAGAKARHAEEGPEVDPLELFRLALQLIATVAGVLESRWADILKAWLPLALELSGRDERALEVRLMLEEGHSRRTGLLGATGLLAAAVAAVVGIASWAFLAAAAAAAFRGIRYCLGTTAAVTHAFFMAVFWDPCW